MKANGAGTNSMTPIDLITELRSAAKGSEEWHVVNGITNARCAIFTLCDSINPKQAAIEYADKCMDFLPPNYASMRVEKVTAYTPQERLLHRAADCIESLIGG